MTERYFGHLGPRLRTWYVPYKGLVVAMIAAASSCIWFCTDRWSPVELPVAILSSVCWFLVVRDTLKRLIAELFLQHAVLHGVKRRRKVRLVPIVRWPGFPRVWELLGFLLGRTIRERIYTPIHHELLEDYLLAKRYRTKGARRWLAFCFTLRTLVLLAECVRAALADKGARLLLKLMPEPLREWWATKGP